MGTFKVSYLFDETVTDRIIVTYDKDNRKYNASVRLVGAAAGYGVYSSGQTPDIAIARALESAEKPERWRRLAF
jgi:hypothetical protein